VRSEVRLIASQSVAKRRHLKDCDKVVLKTRPKCLWYRNIATQQQFPQ